MLIPQITTCVCMCSSETFGRRRQWMAAGHAWSHKKQRRDGAEGLWQGKKSYNLKIRTSLRTRLRHWMIALINFVMFILLALPVLSILFYIFLCRTLSDYKVCTGKWFLSSTFLTKNLAPKFHSMTHCMWSRVKEVMFRNYSPCSTRLAAISNKVCYDWVAASLKILHCSSDWL